MAFCGFVLADAIPFPQSKLPTMGQSRPHLRLKMAPININNFLHTIISPSWSPTLQIYSIKFKNGPKISEKHFNLVSFCH
jgi:hypothetical protein